MARYGRKNFEPIGATQSPRMGDLTVGDYANGMPNIRLGEMFKSLMRQLFWLLPLLVIGFFVAGWFTKDMKRVYSGDSSIMVQLGEEYVYNPVGQSSNGGGLMTTIDTITLTESGLMRNNELIARVIGNMTSGSGSMSKQQAEDRFDSAAFKKINAAKNRGDQRAEQDAIMELRRSVAESYSVMPRPKSSIIDVSYQHEDPDVAVETVNEFVNAYLDFRRQVFVDGNSEVISERREATERQLLSNEQAIARFLKNNDISDFDSEQKGLRKRTEDLKASLNGTRASIAETEAALAEVEDQLRATPETIDLYRDDRAAQRVSQAELELRQLMAKYLPTSDPVRQKQTELSELRALQSSYGGKASGGRRVGPNPTHQALTTRRNTLAASADSLREREFTQQRQLNSADGKIRKLTALSPKFNNLLRERETLKTRLTSYNSKEQEALVDAQQAEAKAENVTVISMAQFANKGRNMQKLAWFGATAAWGFLLGFIAMIRVFLDPRLYAVPAAMQAMPAQQAMPVQQSVMDVAPMHDPIPEGIPAYDPGQPLAPNPYEAQPEIYAGTNPAASYPQAGAYDPNAYVHYSQTGDVYASQHAQNGMTASAGDYAASGGYASPEGANPYQTGYAQTDPNASPQAFAGNAALDLNHNPYATGQVQAGSLDNASGVYLDPNAPPQS